MIISMIVFIIYDNAGFLDISGGKMLGILGLRFWVLHALLPIETPRYLCRGTLRYFGFCLFDV